MKETITASQTFLMWEPKTGQLELHINRRGSWDALDEKQVRELRSKLNEWLLDEGFENEEAR